MTWSDNYLRQSAHFPVSKVVQPCKIPCFLEQEVKCKKHVQHNAVKHIVTPLGTPNTCTSISANVITFSFVSIMARLTEVQRGHAIAMLMQGQRQQQVARHAFRGECLVRCLRDTGRVTDRPRSGRPRVTSQRQDRTIRLSHLRNRNLTDTETSANAIGTHNGHIHPKKSKKSFA